MIKTEPQPPTPCYRRCFLEDYMHQLAKFSRPVSGTSEAQFQISILVKTTNHGHFIGVKKVQ